MTKTEDIKNFFKEGRPLVEQDLDIAEQFKAMRDAAREKNVDWSQVKAILKAQILDEREGTDKRVNALVDKTGTASAYLDTLGFSEKNKTREENCAPAVVRACESASISTAATGDSYNASPSTTPVNDDTPPFLDRRQAVR